MSNLRTDPLRNLNRRRIVVRRRRRPLRCASPVRRVSLSARLPVVKHRRRRNPQHRRTAVLRRHSTAHRLRGRSACAPMPAVGRRRRRRRRPRCRRKERRRKLLRRRFRDRQNRLAMTGSAMPGRRVPSSPLMPLLLSVTPGRMFRRSNRPSRLPTCPPVHLRRFRRQNRLHRRMIPRQHSPRRLLSRQHCRACRRQARLRRRTAVLRQHCRTRRSRVRLHRQKVALRQHSPLRSQLRQHCRTRRSRVRLRCRKAVLRQHSSTRLQPRRDRRARRREANLCQRNRLHRRSVAALPCSTARQRPGWNACAPMPAVGRRRRHSRRRRHRGRVRRL